MQAESLAAYRYEMMEKGYMNKSELSKFIGCGRNKGGKIFQQIMKDIKKEAAFLQPLFIINSISRHPFLHRWLFAY